MGRTGPHAFGLRGTVASCIASRRGSSRAGVALTTRSRSAARTLLTPLCLALLTM